MIRYLCAAILLLAPLPALASSTVTVGSTEFTIPSPSGFVAVTPRMQTLHQFHQNVTPPVNQLVISFIPASEKAAALAGEIPDLTRTFNIQAPKTLLSKTVSKSDFAELKKILKTQTAELIQKAEKEMPGYSENVSKDLSKQFGSNLKFNVSDLIPLPPHEDTERTFGYSMYVKSQFQSPSGQMETAVGAVTMTVIHAKAKILFLYANAEKDQLDWTRKACKTWTASIVQANPGDAETMKAEEKGSSGGFNWNRVLLFAVIGGVAGAISTMFRKKKE